MIPATAPERSRRLAQVLTARRTFQRVDGEEPPPETWTGSESTPLTVHRLLSAIGAFGLFGAAFVTWGTIIQIPFLGAISVASFAAVFVALIVALSATEESTLEKVDVAVLLLGLLLLGAWAASQLYFYPAYGTDEAAYQQYAAQTLLPGHNPYTRSMLPALTQFRVPIQYATYTLSGSISSTLVYPAFSFLFAVPFIWLTHGVQSVIIGNVVFLGIQIVLMFLFLPRRLRVLAPVVGLGLPILFGYTLAGINDAVLAAFLLCVAWRWTDVGRSGTLGRGGVLRAVCLGLALSVQQLAWFMFPFVVAGMVCLRIRDHGRRRAWRLTGAYVAIAGATFLGVNGPFIVWNARAWFRDVVSPFTQHAIPYGQGLVDISAFFRVGGGNLSFYTYAAMAIFVAMLAVFVLFFDRLWRLAFVLPSAALFFPTRSLAEYFMTVIGVWVVSVAAPGSDPTTGMRWLATERWSSGLARWGWRRTVPRWVLPASAGLCFVPGLILVGLALGSGAPLAMHIRSVETNGQLQGTWRIQVDVTNRSRTEISPHFAANYIGQMTSFWYVISGPPRMAPGQQARYTLAAPNIGSMPGLTQPFVLQAVSAHPDTLSSTAPYVPEQFSSYVSPSYIDRKIALGATVALQVELRSPFGGFVHKSGVRVALGQLIYAQSALIPAEARINGMPEGRTPVFAETNGAGVAEFEVSDTSIQGGNPVYFQSYVDPVRGYPYGYSEIVSVLWH